MSSFRQCFEGVVTDAASRRNVKPQWILDSVKQGTAIGNVFTTSEISEFRNSVSVMFKQPITLNDTKAALKEICQTIHL